MKRTWTVVASRFTSDEARDLARVAKLSRTTRSAFVRRVVTTVVREQLRAAS
jgi:hypothetical protein